SERREADRGALERNKGRRWQAGLLSSSRGRRGRAVSVAIHRAACFAAGGPVELAARAARPERVPTQRGRRVVDVALEGEPIPIGQQGERGRVLQRLRLRDAAFRHLTRGAAIAVLIILGGIIVSLVHGSWLALSTFGLNFLISDAWNPVTEKFGALAPMYGT